MRFEGLKADKQFYALVHNTLTRPELELRALDPLTIRQRRIPRGNML